MNEFLQNARNYIESNILSMFPLFILGFLLWGSFVLFIISRVAWNKFAYIYESSDSEAFEKIGIASAKVGKINYNNCLVLSCNKDKFYLKPMLLFRPGHKALSIPFRDIQNIEQKKTFGMKFTVLSFKDENIPTLSFQQKTWNKVVNISGYQIP